ncbi:lanthionine synthetase LanC family protein [Streptomyces resistomycificus]|uniref:Lanthionine synthetase C family protein n=1 Tax=Streptomyces resistomycificus TaxID=67356 RepID=A0A0L8L2J8_9ACTN|nr:lanthionine synthetase LanC family protein [Streptomyces resistomycificus]KOG32468.1 lanthionine synthetase C family protein [Streptomyces resistomycificus]KUO01189.1 lanthionine synthetase C family protein [Streptomyces resistomycificus]
MTHAEGAVVRVDGTEVEALAADALRWLRGTARETGGGGLGWSTRPSDDELNPMLYSGTAGVVPVLLEAWRHFGDDTYADTALRAARSLTAAVDECADSSLYFGLTGMALTLRTVHRELGDPAADVAADRAMELVRTRFDGTRWGELFELMGGNAGIGLGALLVGDADLAVRALEPYARTAEALPGGGVHWEFRTGREGRMHHISHGTLGIVYALATVGTATGRTDLVELAEAGAAGVVDRDEDGPEGFLVAHSDPAHLPDLIARHSYGWCHGPAGDAQVFRGLRDVLGDAAWSALADRCWHTVTRSGLPRRLRPGFWDNNGRCCGTAGVLALACDRIAEQDDGHDFARVLVADLTERATRDAEGARWSNFEHRATPGELEPQTGWAMGNAGIARELMRFVRLGRGGDPDYAFAWPDQPAVRRTGVQATDPIRPAGTDAPS